MKRTTRSNSKNPTKSADLPKPKEPVVAVKRSSSVLHKDRQPSEGTSVKSEGKKSQKSQKAVKEEKDVIVDVKFEQPAPKVEPKVEPA